MKTPRKTLKVVTSAVLGISLLAAPIAPSALAETPAVSENASGTIKMTFPDVPAGHWARSHVAKLAASKIVRGYEDGSFGTNKPVTQQEAIVMAVRMAGLEEEAQAENRDVVLGFDVDPFFRPYVVKALEKRMLNLAEETGAAASGDSNTAWGKRPATREWLAKLVVRAIGKGTDAANAGAPAFTDASKISDGSAGFIKIAVDLGIVTGFKEDNTFRPAEAVTRGQIAAFLSRADQYVPEQPKTAVTGHIVSVSGGAIQLRSSDNQALTFTLDSGALFFRATGQAVASADLRNYQKVKLVHQNNTAYYVEILDDAVQLETFEGKVSELNVGEMSVTLAGASGAQQFKLASNVAAVNEQGSGVSLSDITKQSTVRLQRLPGTTEISNITLVKLALNKSGEGVVQSIDASKRTITVKPADGGAEETYPVSADVTVKLNGTPLSGLSDIKAGDTVAYEVLDSTAVSVDITKQRYVTKTGELFNDIVTDNITVLENGTDLKAYFLVSDVKVNITGLNDAALADLQKGDRIQLNINGNNGKVESITVLDRNITKLNQAKIYSFDKNLKFITILDEKNKAQTLYITDRTQIMLDGAPMSEELYDLYLAKDRAVRLTVSEDQLIRLDVMTYAEGKVSAVNTSSITVTTDQNENITLPLSTYPIVIVPKKSSASLADVTVGTYVRLSLNTNQSSVSQIQVKRSYVYTLTSVDTITRKLSAKDGENTSVLISLETNTAVLNESGKPLALTALKSNDLIVVTYSGTTLLSVSTPSPVLGKVTSVDTAAGKLMIIDKNNNSREYKLTDGVNIQSNGTVGSNPSVIKVNDRVQVVVDGTGAPYVWLATALERTFSSYDAAKNQISFKIAKLGEQAVFGIHSYAYIHGADGSLVTLDRLKENDKLTVYVLDGKVVELIK